MKKIIICLIALISPLFVMAKDESAKVIPIIPRCVYASDREIVVPVEVISQNDGIIDNKLDRYIIGKVDNTYGNIIINKISDKGYNLEVDSLKDSNNYSNVYFSLNNISKLRRYKEMGKVMSFNIIFKVEKIPKKIYVLGTEIIVNKDKRVCQKLNYYNSKEVNDKAIILNESNYIYLMLIGVLVIIIMVLLKRSDKNAIYKY